MTHPNEDRPVVTVPPRRPVHVPDSPFIVTQTTLVDEDQEPRVAKLSPDGLVLVLSGTPTWTVELTQPALAKLESPPEPTQ